MVTAPAGVPLSIAELKAQSRLEGVTGESEEALLAGYLRAAVASLEGRDGWLNRALMTQTWDLKRDCFPYEILLPLPPLQSVTSITYVDTDGDSQTLASSLYQVAGVGGSGRARIAPAYGQTWPSTRDQPEAVTVRFVVGYGDNPHDVPEQIRQALMLMVTESYCDREGEMGLSAGAMALLAPLRAYY